MLTALLCLGAALLDRLLGEPRRQHPLIGFGWLAQRVEALVYGPPELSADARRERGSIAVVLLLLPFTVAAGLLAWLPLIGLAVALGLLYLALGARSLTEHAEAVATALQAGDLALAREKVALMVSRDAADLDEEGISRATVESVLENGSDAVFAPLFWLIIGGAPAVVLYRLSNTLDAMWGYRSERFERFGKWAARVDDVLNWIPARLTALTYALCGQFSAAIHAWRTQGVRWYSPNAGVVMAAGAGALQVQLGGDAVYAGQTKARPPLGAGAIPDAAAITRAIRLLDRGVYLWAGITLIVGGGGVFIA